MNRGGKEREVERREGKRWRERERRKKKERERERERENERERERESFFFMFGRFVSSLTLPIIFFESQTKK